jgi:hypothetical protein
LGGLALVKDLRVYRSAPIAQDIEAFETDTLAGFTITTYFVFLDLRHKLEIYNLTGRVVGCPIDEVNRPRGATDAALGIPPTEAEVETLFTGWRSELPTCRKFAPTARNHAAAKPTALIGRRRLSISPPVSCSAGLCSTWGV